MPDKPSFSTYSDAIRTLVALEQECPSSYVELKAEYSARFTEFEENSILRGWSVGATIHGIYPTLLIHLWPQRRDHERCAEMHITDAIEALRLTLETLHEHIRNGAKERMKALEEQVALLKSIGDP